MRAAVKYLAGLLLAALLVALVLRGTDPREIWEKITEASIAGLFACAALNIGHTFFRVRRWGLLLAPVSPGLAFRPMFSAVIVGYMTTWVLPGRLGELVRPVLLSAREHVPLGPCLGSILADRLLDGLALVVLFGLGMWITPLSGNAAEHAATIRLTSLAVVGLLTVLLLALLAASSHRVRIERWLRTRSGPLPWLGRSMLAFSGGLDALKRPRLLAWIVIHTFAAWLTIALGTWVGVRACGANISFGAMLIILPMLALGVAVPTPGGVGGYHLAMTFGLQLFSISEPVAKGASFLVHLAGIVPVVVLGAVLLVVDRISLREVVEAARQVRQLGAAAGTSLAEKTL